MDVSMQQHAEAMGDLYEARNAFKTMVHQRDTSHEENTDAMEQSKIAVQTMKKAIKLMKKMLTHTQHKQVFLQTLRAKPYTGAQTGGSNVVNMLEVLLDRFQKSYDSMQKQEKQ